MAERITSWRPGQSLNLSHLGLERLPSNLPAGLKQLYCDNNRLTSLENLPASLKDLYCGNNRLTSLEDFPAGLNGLYCNNNRLTSLENLPASLKDLYCNNNRLTSLENLPVILNRLYCHNNRLTSLGNLPAGLEQLDCGSNRLASLENLPAGLNQLDCSGNQLMSLENLPAGLNGLYCSHNQLMSLENLPAGLEELYCYGNPLPFFSLEEWRKIQSIRRRLALIRFQQMYRRRLIRWRVRSKTPINHAIFARPGLGVGWLEACRDVGIDPSLFDVERYRLKSLFTSYHGTATNCFVAPGGNIGPFLSQAREASVESSPEPETVGLFR